jgi:hypothetical protein
MHAVGASIGELSRGQHHQERRFAHFVDIHFDAERFEVFGGGVYFLRANIDLARTQAGFFSTPSTPSTRDTSILIPL